MKIAFLGFDQYQGKFDIGSSLIRCDWPIKYWPESERFVSGKKYDVIIFQKAYWIDYMKEFEGIKILDICDADWLDLGSRVIETIEHADAVTTSSVALAEQVARYCDKPVWCIPDRVDLETHRMQKDHHGRAQSVLWFGYSHNFPALHQAIKPIVDLGLELYVISNEPYHAPPAFAEKLNVTNYSWNAETINADILKADIVLNPKLPVGRFKYKSSNKTVKAWALGMPVAESDRDLKKFMDPEARRAEATLRRAEIQEKWDVRQSVEEYKALIIELCEMAINTGLEE